MEEYIQVNYETIGVKELRQLQDLSNLNRVLTQEEFFKIIGVYYEVIGRMQKEAIKQGIEI